jgi:hypothetical protein
VELYDVAIPTASEAELAVGMFLQLSDLLVVTAIEPLSGGQLSEDDITPDTTPSTAASAMPLRLPRRPRIRCSQNTRSLPEGPMHSSLCLPPKHDVAPIGARPKIRCLIRGTALSLSWERRLVGTSNQTQTHSERCGPFRAPTMSAFHGAGTLGNKRPY